MPTTIFSNPASGLILCVLILSACSLPVRKAAVPRNLSKQAEVIGLPGVRYVVRDEMPEFAQEDIASFYREQAYHTESRHDGELPPGL